VDLLKPQNKDKLVAILALNLFVQLQSNCGIERPYLVGGLFQIGVEALDSRAALVTRSAARGTPCAKGKCGDRRAICLSLNKKKSVIRPSSEPVRNLNHN
jgi:hypothetical protein